jgi:hypothetical protein
MLKIIELVSFIASVLFIWFKTEAFVEYCKLLNLFKSHIKEYELTAAITFPQYLFRITKNSKYKFIFGLITCPVCLCLWLSFLGCLLTGCLVYTFIVYILTLFVYFNLSRVMN